MGGSRRERRIIPRRVPQLTIDRCFLWTAAARNSSECATAPFEFAQGAGDMRTHAPHPLDARAFPLAVQPPRPTFAVDCSRFLGGEGGSGGREGSSTSNNECAGTKSMARYKCAGRDYARDYAHAMRLRACSFLRFLPSPFLLPFLTPLTLGAVCWAPLLPSPSSAPRRTCLQGAR